MRGIASATAVALAVAVGTGNSHASAQSAPVPVKAISLARCDSTDPAQKWTLNAAGWGSNNTIQNAALDPTSKDPQCLDVSEWDVSSHRPVTLLQVFLDVPVVVLECVIRTN